MNENDLQCKIGYCKANPTRRSDMIMTQHDFAGKSTQLLVHLNQLLQIVGEGVEQHTPLHEIEQQTFDVLMEMGRSSLKMLLEKLGKGDVGESIEVEENRTLNRSKVSREREYVSIFGSLQLKRFVYAKREGAKIEVVPLDARIG